MEPSSNKKVNENRAEYMKETATLNPIEKLQLFLSDQLQELEAIRVLEAGCGSASHFCFNQKVTLTGIDISEKQLQRNKSLDKAIVGDVQVYDFGVSSFDLIISWTVLEHLDKPELALDRLARSLHSGGLLVLALPNLYSLKGIATKFLPLGVHTWYYKHIFGRRNAGRDDVGPFRTFLRRAAAPNEIKRFAGNNGLEVVYFHDYDVGESSVWQRKRRLARALIALYKVVRNVLGIATFGKLGKSEFIIVLRKRALADRTTARENQITHQF